MSTVVGCDATPGPEGWRGRPWVAWACVSSDQRLLYGRLVDTANSTLGELWAITRAATLLGEDGGLILSDSRGMVLWLERLRTRGRRVPPRRPWLTPLVAEAVEEELLARPLVRVEWRRRNSTRLLRRADRLATDARWWRIDARLRRGEGAEA